MPISPVALEKSVVSGGSSAAAPGAQATLHRFERGFAGEALFDWLTAFGRAPGIGNERSSFLQRRLPTQRKSAPILPP